MQALRVLACALVLAVAACSPPASQSQAEAPNVQPISAQARGEMQRINSATTIAMPPRPQPIPDAEVASVDGAPAAEQAQPAAPPQQEAFVQPGVTYDAGLVRLQVLLDRSHISPGVIDGYDGDNVRKAISEYQAREDLSVTGRADAALLQHLSSADSAPALITYVIAEEDTRGPFVTVPRDLQAQSRLDHLGYANAAEGIAEKFHMDADLLALLNPGVDFAQAGQEIVVANAGGELSGQVARIEVDKGAGAVRAFGADNALLAFYPASIGSSDAPAPSGDFTVRAVAFDPVYNYDPARLPTFGRRDHGALAIQPGPNNPVGAVWIALSLDTYGIHGTPNPSQVSKTQSHGCVRLTNWDATELGRAVREGVPVSFSDGRRQAAASTQAPT